MRVRLLIAYLVFAALLIAFYKAVHAPAIDAAVIAPMTHGLAWIGAKLMLAAGTQVWSAGTHVSSLNFSIDIHKGCDGVEALGILWAAIIAYPWPGWGKLAGLRGRGGATVAVALSPLWVRLFGLVAGAILLQLANVARIVSLFYIGLHWPELFAKSHVLVWQSLIILVALAIWYLWVVKVADAWR